MSWWTRIRDRHDDGTKHEWRMVDKRIGAHSCGYSYCHCYWKRCTVCQIEFLQSDGVDEQR